MTYRSLASIRFSVPVHKLSAELLIKDTSEKIIEQDECAESGFGYQDYYPVFDSIRINQRYYIHIHKEQCDEQQYPGENIAAYQLHEERKELGRYLIAYEFDEAVCTEYGSISGTEAFIGDDKKAQQSGGGIAQKSIEKAFFLVKRYPKQKRCEEKKRKARGV